MFDVHAAVMLIRDAKQEDWARCSVSCLSPLYIVPGPILEGSCSTVALR